VAVDVDGCLRGAVDDDGWLLRFPSRCHRTAAFTDTGTMTDNSKSNSICTVSNGGNTAV
jgi:hypothetical protein